MPGYIHTVALDCPDAQVLAGFYAEVMSMPTRFIDTADQVVIGNDRSRARLAFATVADYRPPTWPDPSYPQQLHLCGPTAFLGSETESPTEMVLRLGATALPDLGGDCPVFADPAGHPFCLCAVPPASPADEARVGEFGSVAFDCFTSPQGLASFYADLVDMPVRVDDTDDWVVIESADGQSRLAFQRAHGRSPKWRDPARPQQIHLDIAVDDLAAAADRAARLGATKLAEPAAHRRIFADPEGHPFCLVPENSANMN